MQHSAPDFIFLILPDSELPCGQFFYYGLRDNEKLFMDGRQGRLFILSGHSFKAGSHGDRLLESSAFLLSREILHRSSTRIYEVLDVSRSHMMHRFYKENDCVPSMTLGGLYRCGLFLR